MPIIEDEFLFSHSKAGSLFASISFGNGLSLFVMGIFAGMIGYRRTIILSFVFGGLLLLLLSFTERSVFLYPILFSLGFTTGAYLPSILPTLTVIYHERLWGKVLPIHDSAAAASILAAPFLSLFLLKFLSWRQIFLLLGIFFFSFTSLLLLLTKDFEESKMKKGSKMLSLDLLKERPLWFLNLIWIFSAGSNMGLYNILPLFLSKELMLDLSYANKIVGMARVGALFSAIFVAFIVDLFEIRKFLFFLLFSSGLLTFLMPLSPLKILPFVLFTQSTIIQSFFPCSFVFASRLFPLEKRAFATGFMVSLGSMVGIGFIPYVLGIFGDHLSFAEGIEFLGLSLLLISFLIFKV